MIINRYGSTDVLEERDLADPLIKNNAVKIKVIATSVNPLDYKIRRGDFRLLTGKDQPNVNILGFDICGEVLEIGNRVTRFKIGDRVFSTSPMKTGGGNAEIAIVPEEYLAFLPENIEFTQGAGVPLAALTAFQALKNQGSLCMGESILINGASGGVGTFAVQIAKALGAHVTAVCSEKNIEKVKELGANQVINYQKDNFITQYNAYDIVFDVVGNSSLRECHTCLKPYGYYVTTQPSLKLVLKSSLLSLFPGKKERCVIVKPNGEDLATIGEMIKKGKIKTMIDRVFELSDLAEAHSYCESNRIFGKTIITIQKPTVKEGIEKQKEKN